MTTTFYYLPQCWEFTSDDRGHIEDSVGLDPGDDPIEVGVLEKRPSKYLACVILTRDEHGDADETEMRWFDTQDAARAAMEN